jgi:hypothetical protein
MIHLELRRKDNGRRKWRPTHQGRRHTVYASDSLNIWERFRWYENISKKLMQDSSGCLKSSHRDNIWLQLTSMPYAFNIHLDTRYSIRSLTHYNDLQSKPVTPIPISYFRFSRLRHLHRLHYLCFLIILFPWQVIYCFHISNYVNKPKQLEEVTNRRLLVRWS